MIKFLLSIYKLISLLFFAKLNSPPYLAHVQKESAWPYYKKAQISAPYTLSFYYNYSGHQRNKTEYERKCWKTSNSKLLNNIKYWLRVEEQEINQGCPILHQVLPTRDQQNHGRHEQCHCTIGNKEL